MLEGGETSETLAPPPMQDASRLKRPRVTSPGSKTLIEPEHGSARSPSSVSYTHLTLPTIYSV